MGEFFHGWRRKVGLMTLLMACLLSACWFRSYSINDTISIPISHTEYLQVASSNQHLIFGSVLLTTIDGEGRERLPMWMANPTKVTGIRHPQWRFATFGDRHLDKYLDKARPNIGMGRDWKRMQTRSSEFTIDYRYVGTMYWWFVAPLTLLSAWLLLSKPRKSKHTKITEPIAAEGK